MNGEWMDRRTFLRYTVLAGAYVTALNLGCIQPTKPETIQVGTILDLTGDLGTLGLPIQQGTDLAAKQINEKGGVLGKTFELIHEDAGTTPEGAVKAMNKLVNVNKVPAVVGAMASSESLAIIPIGRDNEVVMISPSSTSPLITTADDGGYFFRTCASDAFQGKVLAKVASDMGYKKVAHIYINNDYGVAMNDVIKENAPMYNLEFLIGVAYNPGQASYRSELEKLISGNPEALIFTGYPEYGSVILKQAKEMGITVQWILAEGLKDETLAKNLGADLVEGMVGTAPLPPASPQYESFASAFEKEFGAPPGIYAANAYDATWLIALAMEKAKDTKGRAIRDVLIEVSKEYNGASGPCTFDENGDVAGDFELWKFKGGKIVHVKKVEI